MARCVAIGIQGHLGADSEEDLARVGKVLKALFEGGARELRIGGLFEVNEEPAPKLKPKAIKKAKTLALPAPNGAHADRKIAATDIAHKELAQRYPGTVKPNEIIPQIKSHGFNANSAYAAMYALEKAGTVKRYADGSYKLKHAPRPGEELPVKHARAPRNAEISVDNACAEVVSALKEAGRTRVTRPELFEMVSKIRPGTVLQSIDRYMGDMVKAGKASRPELGVYNIH